jgi:hypothetical protein
MADIKQLNFCAAGRRADPGVCVAWSVPLRSGIDARCTTRQGSWVEYCASQQWEGACEMFCVRASSRPSTNPNAHAALPKQGRYDFNHFLLRRSSHAIMARRGAAKREEIDVPK